MADDLPTRAEPAATPPASTERQRPLLQMTKARILEFWREPAAVFWVFGFPVLLAVALGLAFREQPPEPIRAGVEAGAPHAAALTEALGDAELVTLMELPAAELDRALAKGSVDLIVRGYAPPMVDVLVDPTRPESRLARLELDRAIQAKLGRRDVATIRSDTNVPRGSRYIDFLLPGLIALNIIGSSLWGVGYSIVTERSKKLLRRYVVTPMRRRDFLLAIMLSRLCFLIVEVAALLLFGAWAFDVTLQGSVLAVMGIAFLGGIAMTGLAIFVSARTESVEVASGLINLVMMPMWIVSGTFFPYERFPEVLHPLIEALPLTAMNNAMRGIINFGQPLSDFGSEMLVLAIWGFLGFVIGLKVFRWR